MSKQFERLSKRELEQSDLTLGRFLDTHFPMPAPLSNTKGRTSTVQSNIPSLILHMIWTYTELEDDDSDHWFQPIPELSFQREDSSTTTPTAPTTISAEVPISTSSDGSLESQQQQHTPQEEQFESPSDSDSASGSEPELPELNHVVNRKVSIDYPTVYYQT